MIVFSSKLHITFAYLSSILLLHHVIYHDQVIFCCFEKLIQFVVSHLNLLIKKMYGTLHYVPVPLRKLL